MSTRRLFFPAGIKIDATYLGHVGDQSVDQKLEDLEMFPAGDWAPDFTGSKQKAPEYQVDCLDVTKALDLMTTEALCCPLTSKHAKLFYRAAQVAALAYAAGSSEHTVYELQDDSVLFWESLTANQNDDLKIALRLVAMYNGVNASLLALPAQTIDVPATQNAPFTLGPIQLDGVAIGGLKSFTWTNNVEVLKEADSGDAVPTLVCLRKVKPVISFESTDLYQIAGFDPDGSGVGKVTCYLRRRRPNGLNYADTDAVHAKLVADKGLGSESVATLKWKSTGGDPARAKCELHLNRVGTASLWTYTKNVAIT